MTSKERASSPNGGATDFSVDKVDFKEGRSRRVASDVPAFEEAPYITTSKDYISKINFELAYMKFPGQAIKTFLGTWEDIHKQFSEVENQEYLKRRIRFFGHNTKDYPVGKPG